MPDIISKIHTGDITLNGTPTKRWIEEHDDQGQVAQRALSEEEEAQTRATGFRSWEDWTRENWGTKCNAYKSEVWCSKDKVLFSFLTAWSPPDPVAEHFRERFPDLALHCASLEEGVLTCPYTVEEIDASWRASEEARKSKSRGLLKPAARNIQPGIVEAAP